MPYMDHIHNAITSENLLYKDFLFVKANYFLKLLAIAIYSKLEMTDGCYFEVAEGLQFNKDEVI